MAYLLDTGVFVQAKNFHYSFGICPGFWQWLDQAHEKGFVLSISDCLKELAEKEDELSHWAKVRKKLFRKSEDEKAFESAKLLSGWVQSHFSQEAQNKFFADADFMLVAYAHAHNLTAVSHETFQRDCARVKIPNACAALGVDCITPFQMLAKSGARFVLDSGPVSEQ